MSIFLSTIPLSFNKLLDLIRKKMKRAILNEADNVFMWWDLFRQNVSNEELYQQTAPSAPEHSLPFLPLVWD